MYADWKVMGSEIVVSNKLETQLDNYDLKGIMSVVCVAREISPELMAEINAKGGYDDLDSWYSLYTQLHVQFDG